MSSYLVTNPWIQAIDASGNPYSGALLNIYDAGTTDRRTTYSNSSLTTANANPLVADSAGRFGEVFVAPSTSRLKFTLTTSSDVEIDTIDNIPVDDGTLIDVTDAEIAAGVTVVNYAYHESNVLRYGTNTTPGTTDMAAAFQAAIDVNAAGGNRVHGPPVSYGIRTKLTVTDQTEIDMQGATLFQIAGSDQATLLEAFVSGTESLKIHITIDGNKANNATVVGAHIRGPQTSTTDIRIFAKDCDTGVLVDGNTENNYMFIHGTGCDTLLLERYDSGIHASTPDENTYFISGNGNGTVYHKSCLTGGKITSSVFLSCEAQTDDAVKIETVNGTSVTHLHGIIRGCAADGVYVNAPDSVIYFHDLHADGQDTSSTWGLLVDDVSYLHGSLKIANFDGGAWIKKTAVGQLDLEINALDGGGAGVQLGDSSGGTSVQRFQLSGNITAGTSTNGIYFDNAFHCAANMAFVSGGTNAVLIDGSSANNVVRVNGRSISAADYVDNSASARDNRFEFDGEYLGVMTDSDATPDIGHYPAYQTGTASVTITAFEKGYPGKRVTIISKGAITFDTSPGTRLIGSSADIVTADGDITEWVCETAGGSSVSVWRLVAFVDISVDNSAGA